MVTGVTPTEVAAVVHGYLLAEGHLRAADAFAADAAELLAPLHAVRAALEQVLLCWSKLLCWSSAALEQAPGSFPPGRSSADPT